MNYTVSLLYRDLCDFLRVELEVQRMLLRSSVTRFQQLLSITDSVTAATAAAEAAAAATAAEDVNSKLRGKCVTTDSLVATGVLALKKCEDSVNANALHAALVNHFDLNTAADNGDVNDDDGDDGDENENENESDAVAVDASMSSSLRLASVSLYYLHYYPEQYMKNILATYARNNWRTGIATNFFMPLQQWQGF
uniref:Uncharacterized protein n=1 Tax=Glossina brevipalpis TaxID=37001 RepID=A0A1A9WT66_9MUSC